MDIGTIVILSAAVVFSIALWFILGKVAKGVRTVITSTFFILLTAGTLYMYWESNSLQQHFITDPKLFVYTEGDILYAGFEIVTDTPLPIQDISGARDAYARKDITRLRGNAFKLIITSPDTFSNVQSINISGMTFTKDEAINLIRSTSPKQEYIQRFALMNNIDPASVSGDTLGTDDNLRGLIYATLISHAMQKEDMLIMMRDGRVTITPDSLTLWLIRTAPDPLLKYLVKGN